MRDISQDFSAYLDGELAAEDVRRVEAVAAAPGALACQLHALRSTRGLLRALPRVPAPEGFLARVLAEAHRRGLLSAGGRGSYSARRVWLGRFAAAAVVLVGAALGAVVLTTMSGRPEVGVPVAARPEPSPVLAEARERAGGPADDSLRSGASAPAASRKGDGAEDGPIARADSAAARAEGSAPAGGGGADEVLAKLKQELAMKLKAPSGPAAGRAETLEFQVAHLGAARREVHAILAAAGIHRIDQAAGEVAAGSAGVAAGKEGAATGDLYYEAPAGPEAWRFVVVASDEPTKRLASGLRGLACDRKDADITQRQAPEDSFSSRARGARAAASVPAAKPGAASPVVGAQSAPYAVVELERLADGPGTAPAGRPAEAAQPRAEARRLMVITLRAAANVQADPMRNVRE